MKPRAQPVEMDDVQGLARFAYKRHTEAAFVLLRVKHRDAGRAWLAGAPIASARTIEPPPETALQIALTSAGMRALGVAEDILGGFSPEFTTGMGGDANLARRLGDVGANDPDLWQWGTGLRVPHVLLMLYALPGKLAAWQSAIEAQCADGFEALACLSSSDMGGVEPFGFVDGISQPQPDWERQRPVQDESRLTYTNLSCLGEFLLGYPNEYGGYTDRPLLDAQRDTLGLLPRAEDAPDQADVGRNGSYLVMRQLQQDVHGFWKYVDHQSAGNGGLRDQLAAAMVGRALSGEPLIGLSADAPPGDLNAFSYGNDPRGVRCPLGAHVRRANPRNADLPPGSTGLLSRLVRMLGFNADARQRDLVASARFHRLLRRGREYGERIPIAQALGGQSNGADPGLHFICLNANIARQFEFVQAAWVNSLKFDGLTCENDPLIGQRAPAPDGTCPSSRFSIQQPEGADRLLTGLPQFVTVLGGGYFFLPGIRALRYLATEGSA
jgi:Dyp-type peroxidase family